MSRGHSLHLGVAQVDPIVYQGRFRGTMHGAEPDARAMRDIAARQGFTTTLLLTREATRAALRSWLLDADRLSPGSSMLITYAGHGARFRTRTVDDLEGRDESWCLWDDYLLGEELHDLLAELPARKRVLVVSDSCYSGAIIDAKRPAAAHSIARADARNVADQPAVTATVILLAACAADMVARGSREQGRFTAALVEVWDDGRFHGSHEDLRAAIATRLVRQVPVLARAGARNPEFEASRPFTP